MMPRTDDTESVPWPDGHGVKAWHEHLAREGEDERSRSGSGMAKMAVAGLFSRRAPDLESGT